MESEAHFSISGSFREAFKQLVSFETVERIWQDFVSARGAPAKLSGVEMVMSLIYHFFCPTGTLAEHVNRLTGCKMSDSALSQRRRNIAFGLFEELMKAVLAPLAKQPEHPDAFYRGLRLVAIDGTQFSVINTSQLLSCLNKAATRRFKAAFAKIGVCVLVELGLHNPLAAAISDKQEAELTLAQRLLSSLPPCSLLLADRLFGTGTTVSNINQACQKAPESHFLVRVRKRLKRKVLETFEDGSAKVEVKVRDAQRRVIGVVCVREIRGRVCKAGGTWTEVLLWSSLLDAQTDPAQELLALYAKRWEQELYYKELKIDLRSSEVLKSHTVQTAVQEIAALIIASAIIARQRSAVAQGAEVEVCRISFRKTCGLLDSLWIVLQAAQGLLARDQLQSLVDQTLKLICNEALLPPRRPRSCPRAVRQPVKKWPRLLHNSSLKTQPFLALASHRIPQPKPCIYGGI